MNPAPGRYMAHIPGIDYEFIVTENGTLTWDVADPVEYEWDELTHAWRRWDGETWHFLHFGEPVPGELLKIDLDGSPPLWGPYEPVEPPVVPD